MQVLNLTDDEAGALAALVGYTYDAPDCPLRGVYSKLVHLPNELVDQFSIEIDGDEIQVLRKG